jgi:hypothetical protein
VVTALSVSAPATTGASGALSDEHPALTLRARPMIRVEKAREFFMFLLLREASAGCKRAIAGASPGHAAIIGMVESCTMLQGKAHTQRARQLAR